jgi:hypothetical protein
VTLGLSALVVAPAFSATLQGAVEAKWTVAATASLTLATQYSTTTGAQGTSAPSLLPSLPGVCSGTGTTETALTLTYGSLTPNAGSEVGCDYQQAILANVVTNDSSGFKINEFLEAAPTGGITFCAFPNGSTTTGTTAPAAAASQFTSTGPAAYTGSACATGGTVLVAGTGGTPGSGAGQPGTGEASATAPTSGDFVWVSAPGATSGAQGANYGQDLQINLAANQASSPLGDKSYIIVQLVTN